MPCDSFCINTPFWHVNTKEMFGSERDGEKSTPTRSYLPVMNLFPSCCFKGSIEVHINTKGVTCEVHCVVPWLMQCTRDGVWEDRQDLNFISFLFTGLVLACVLSWLLLNNHYGNSSGMRVKYKIKGRLKRVDFSCCMNSWYCKILSLLHFFMRNDNL